MTMDEVLIRQVERKDLNECFLIEAACYTTDGATEEKIGKRIDVFPEGFLVAELNGRVVGFINGGSTSKEDITDEAFKDMVGHDSSGTNIVIFSVAIHPDFQKKGISVPLLEKYIELSRDLQKNKILLICKDELISYYERFGFSYIAESSSEHGGFNWHEMGLLLNEESSILSSATC
ncbi:MAG: GNAT family N-acetyltransferase [Desulfobacteraceae bacterium]|nr:GNAT family N-acetyltransferase [Desulfobacteraceae bacterium]